MPGERMTKAQRELLALVAKIRSYYPGPKGASTARSLVRRGCLVQLSQYGPYDITEKGRAALAAEAGHG